MRIAIFDVSHWHFPLYLPALADAGITIVGVSDREGFAGEAMASRLGCPLMSRDALLAQEFDFALVFSRHAEMAALADALIERRRPFMIEKPCGLSVREVAGVNRRAKEAGVFVAVPFILRVSDLMRRITADETLSPGGYRYLSFRFIVGLVSRYERNGCGWMLDAGQAGGGSAMNVGLHFYDLVAAMTGSPIASVAGQTRRFRHDVGVEEFAAFTLTTRSGQAAHVHTGYLYPSTPEDQREFSFSVAHDKVYFQGYSDQIASKRHDGAARRETIEYNTDRFYPDFLRDSLERCRAGSPPLAGLDEAERAVAVVEAGYRSAQTNGAAIPVGDAG